MSVEASTYAMVDIEDQIAYIGIRSADDRNVVQMLINAVSEDCQRRFCKRNFLKTTYTDEKYDGDGSAVLVVRQWPIISVDSLVTEEDGTALTENTDFFVYGDEGVIRLRNYRMPISLQQVVITYDAGYDGIDNLPAELKMAVMKGVSWKYKIQGHVADGLINQGLEGQSANYISQEYPSDVLAIFKSYRRKSAYGV